MWKSDLHRMNYESAQYKVNKVMPKSHERRREQREEFETRKEGLQRGITEILRQGRTRIPGEMRHR